MIGQQFAKLKTLTKNAVVFMEHGGSGPPLLFLHGYPQSHTMWHQVAPHFVGEYRVICPDLRGYGDSSKPKSSSDHETYSKRAMAQDMVEVMEYFGYREFSVVGHDRGARVAHRLALDYPERVKQVCLMDIVPTYHMFKHADQVFATGYYHWFFLIQPDGLPEKLIGADPAYYLTEKLKRWSAPDARFAPEAVADYIRCFSNPDTIRASCDDYRAAASIDLAHDGASLGQKIRCPLLVLWGAQGFIQRTYDVLEVWRGYAERVEGQALDCGHFLPEEKPGEVTAALRAFFAKE
ncbi:MAG TPA: alpha/beta hydrolase [Candidatus Competibacter sp.]|nr:alpha/beta hydrolase [Candidatus Competibacteraceae bacterium]HUM93167.1 alpha/beta hydrolase [Candidatus Competibacter sp.]